MGITSAYLQSDMGNFCVQKTVNFSLFSMSDFIFGIHFYKKKVYFEPPYFVFIEKNVESPL